MSRLEKNRPAVGKNKRATRSLRAVAREVDHPKAATGCRWEVEEVGFRLLDALLFLSLFSLSRSVLCSSIFIDRCSILNLEGMGNTSSMLTQYDIEEVQEYCRNLFSQQEIVSLYQRFCQLDRNAKGFISADEFLSVPEFALNPLSQRLLRMIDGLNFKDFVAFLSSFSSRASLQQKIEFIFKVYDLDCNGKVTFNDILEVLKDLTGTFIAERQREHVLTRVLEEAGYSKETALGLDDFIKILSKSGLRMEVEVPVD